MSSSFPFKHWFYTLLLGPLTSLLFDTVFGSIEESVIGLFEAYPFTVIFSILFSIPTLIVYLGVFYLLSKWKASIWVAKIILIAVAVLGIFITFTIENGPLSDHIIQVYSLTSVVVGISFRLKRKEKLAELDIQS